MNIETPLTLISGGYFVAIPTRRPDGMRPDLVPDNILTASACLTTFAPDTWAIAWTGETEAFRQTQARAFGLDDEARAKLTTWATEAMETGELLWPNVLPSLTHALTLARQYMAGCPEVLVFGIALPGDCVAEFLAETAHESGPPGVVAAVMQRALPTPGTVLGWDVLGWDTGGFHSYLCNGLDTVFDDVLGLKPNAFGYFDTLEDARRAAAYTGLETTGAEPGIWLPWQVQTYAIE